MSIARALYDTCSFESDYGPIINHFGEVLLRGDVGDYQGSSFIVYDDYSLLEFGWGSCSGCDALQSCDTFEEIDELIDSLEGDILRFSSKEIFIKYINNRDWEGEWAYGEEGFEEFLEKAKKL